MPHKKPNPRNLNKMKYTGLEYFKYKQRVFVTNVEILLGQLDIVSNNSKKLKKKNIATSVIEWIFIGLVRIKKKKKRIIRKSYARFDVIKRFKRIWGTTFKMCRL